MEKYLEVNLANWNSRVTHHVAGYGLDSFTNNSSHVSEVVEFDRQRLGNIEGLDVLHLQCHIGTDTLSLARLGAKSVTGVDFSAPALDAARDLARTCGADIRYVESDVYSAVDIVGAGQFDLVYTGIGALCWLPDIARWAQVVSQFLRPGGRLFIREGHPMLWTMCDPREDELLVVQYPYFETSGTTFTESYSYVEHDQPLSSPETIGFNHGLGEIITALMSSGMQLTSFEEHSTVPYNPLGTAMRDVGGGEYQLCEHPERMPMTYTLQAVKL